MIPRGLEYALFRQPLDTAGDFILEQRIGYFHLWRLEDGTGTLALDGEINVSFGAASTDDYIPFAYNSRLQLSPPQDRCRVRWNAQPGRVAVILVSANAEGVEANNTPARQLVVSSGSTTLGSGAVLVTTNTQVRPANSLRARLTVQVDPEASGRVAFGASGLAINQGIILNPGDSFTFFTTAEIRAIANIASTRVTYVEEIS